MMVGLVLAALVMVAGSIAWTGWAGAVGLLGVSGWWLRVNKPMEGQTLLVVSWNHGLTAGDLAGLAGALIALARLAVLTHQHSGRARVRRRP